MVSVTKHHSLHLIDNRRSPNGIAARYALTSYAVALHIALVHNIEAVFVCQFIEIRVVGIVRGTDCVDICLFHKAHILQKSLLRNCPAVVGVEVVTVCATKHHRLTVEKNFLADDFNLLKAEADRLVNF